jgi:low affinity Fe/Cu permease
MFSTYRWNGTLVVISPTSPRLFKFQFTWTAIAILALSCLISFFMVVALGYTFPPLVTDKQKQMMTEMNDALRVANRNAEVGAIMVGSRVERMEATSKEIEALIESE